MGLTLDVLPVPTGTLEGAASVNAYLRAAMTTRLDPRTVTVIITTACGDAETHPHRYV